MTITINGSTYDAGEGDRLVDVIGRVGIELPHVCYHPQLGPIQTCDTCMVEVDGELVRACAPLGLARHDGSYDHGSGRRRRAAEAFDRILRNHLLYCTVCDNNNGNCTVHNTTKLLDVEHQHDPFQAKPYEVDNSNPFYRYDPDQCILCGRCVEACQRCAGQRDAVDPLGGCASARAVGWRLDDRRIELRFLRPLRHGLPLQRPDGEVDARARGFHDGLSKLGRSTA